MQASVENVRALTQARMEQYAGSPFFGFADRELDRIEERLLEDRSPDRPFYESLNIGLMCARELEEVDPEFCDAVYSMLEDIRLRSMA